MCFKNLPVEFDAQGNPSLRGGIPDPYTASMAPANVPMQLTQAQVEELVRRNGHLKSVDFDPVTRVAGALAFHAKADLQERRIYEARSVATLFRGYEVIMVGRDPRDAIYITSRACGVCGGVHSTCSALAIEMAIDCVPPPLGVIVRNLALALEFLYDHPLHLHLLAGPDYSAAIVEPTNPALYARAKVTEAPHAAVHGYRTMAALMEDLNPLTGKLYVEALHMTRVAREAYVLICGKYPHPQTIVPGGMSSTITLTVMNEMYVRLSQFFDYGKKIAAIWDDITDFFYEANPAYKQVGQRRANMIDTGIFDHPDAYDATYKNANAWGEKRWATPGAIVVAARRPIVRGASRRKRAKRWMTAGISRRRSSPLRPSSISSAPRPSLPATRARTWGSIARSMPIGAASTDVRIALPGRRIPISDIRPASSSSAISM